MSYPRGGDMAVVKVTDGNEATVAGEIAPLEVNGGVNAESVRPGRFGHFKVSGGYRWLCVDPRGNSSQNSPSNEEAGQVDEALKRGEKSLVS